MTKLHVDDLISCHVMSCNKLVCNQILFNMYLWSDRSAIQPSPGRTIWNYSSIMTNKNKDDIKRRLYYERTILNTVY